MFLHLCNKAHLNCNKQPLFWHSFFSMGFIYRRMAEQYELPQWIFQIIGKTPMAKYTVQWTGTQEHSCGISARQTGSDAKFSTSLSRRASILKQLPWVYIICLSFFITFSIFWCHAHKSSSPGLWVQTQISTLTSNKSPERFGVIINLQTIKRGSCISLSLTSLPNSTEFCSS